LVKPLVRLRFPLSARHIAHGFPIAECKPRHPESPSPFNCGSLLSCHRAVRNPLTRNPALWCYIFTGVYVFSRRNIKHSAGPDGPCTCWRSVMNHGTPLTLHPSLGISVPSIAMLAPMMWKTRPFRVPDKSQGLEQPFIRGSYAKAAALVRGSDIVVVIGYRFNPHDRASISPCCKHCVRPLAEGCW
jgi:hypothetical protein